MKKQKPSHGFFYLHLCDIDQHDFEKRESLLEQVVRKNSFTTTVHKSTQYLSSLKPLDSSTQTIIDNLSLAAVKMELTPVVFVDETLANAYEFIGRLQYGAVVIYDGNSIDMESLINYSSKYVDLAHNYKTTKSMKGHESIQIVPKGIFEFNIEKALNETLDFYRFAPSKLIPVKVQMYLRGNLSKLIEILESSEPLEVKDLKTKKPFEISPELVTMLSQYDTTLSKTAALSILKRNKSLNKNNSIKNQFVL